MTMLSPVPVIVMFPVHKPLTKLLVTVGLTVPVVSLRVAGPVKPVATLPWAS